MSPKPPRAARKETTRPTKVGVKRRKKHRGGNGGERGESHRGWKRDGEAALTVRVALFPDPVHSAVGVDAQEEAPVFAVQPLGVLEVAGREGAAAAVLRQGGQRGDAPGCHGPTGALPGCPRPRSRAGSRRPPAPAPDPARGTAPAPAPQPPARRRATAPAGPQGRAARQLRSASALERRAPRGSQPGFRAGCFRGRRSPKGRVSKLRRPGSGCDRGHRVRCSGTRRAAASHLLHLHPRTPTRPARPRPSSLPARRPLLARDFTGRPLGRELRPQHARARH